MGPWKWVLIALASAFGLLVVCCLVGFFVGIPRLRDDLQRSIEDGVATEVARQIPSTPGVGAQPGEYVITEQSLQQSLRENSDSDNQDNLIVRIDVTGVEIGVSSSRFDATYTGTPAAEDGRFVMNDMDTNSSALGWVLSPKRFGRAVSDAVNGYLEENGLRLESLELQPGQMVLVTAAR